MADNAYVNSQSSTGTCTVTAPSGTAGTTWVLTSLQVSIAGPIKDANAKLNVYDGAVGGTVIFSVFLPMVVQAGMVTGGSVGIIQDIPLPKSPQGVQMLQSSPGNAMNIQVVGTGGNQVSMNARFSDGLPTLA